MNLNVVQSPILYLETKPYGKGVKVLDTHINLEWLLSHFKASIRFNLMTHEREIIIPNQFIFPEDIENSALHLVTYLATLNDMPIKQIDAHLNAIAAVDAYHPIIECLKNNPWDGTNRLEDFLKTIKTTGNEDLLYHEIIKTWMIAAVAAAHSENGFTNHGVLVLLGKQGIGKTSWIRKLNPIDDPNVIRIGAYLNTSDKDNVYELSKHWINELGELECIVSKQDAGKLKNFITMSADYIRLAYARKHTRIPRRSVYIGTVNDEDYLMDRTGNRRWWTIPCREIEFNHDFDMKQVWAEVYELYKEKALSYLNQAQQDFVNNKNKSHEKVDPLKEKLLTHYDWNMPLSTFTEKSATKVLNDLGYLNPQMGELRRIGQFLREKNNLPGRLLDGITVHKVPSRFR